MSKRILIVGGNSGIGEKLNKLLQEEGKETILMSRSQGGVDIQEDEPNFPEIKGAIDALVYCPGSINLKPFRGLKLADFQHDLTINYLGAVKTIKNIKDILRAEGG